MIYETIGNNIKFYQREQKRISQIAIASCEQMLFENIQIFLDKIAVLRYNKSREHR